eukprot:gene40902-50605_t
MRTGALEPVASLKSLGRCPWNRQQPEEVKKVNSQSTHTIPSSALTKALKAIYGTASALNEFMDTHIAALKASENATISRTGELLGEAKTGFMIGYVTPIAVVAVGQLLLGN